MPCILEPSALFFSSVVRLFLPSARVTDRTLTITGEKAHYLASVLRCRPNDKFIVFDGTGTCFLALIKECRKREVIAEVLETFSRNLESPLYSVLVQGILRGDKMDMVIQKTTELGVAEFIPLITDRSQLRGTRKVARWRKIAEEAARQSGRSVVPVVHEPIALRTFLSELDSSPAHRGFICYEEGGSRLSDIAKEFHAKGERGSTPLIAEGALFVLIGPEGGFTREEVNFAEERGLTVISLGKRVLRAETAAISAVTLVQYLFGDMG